jgi:hypothetical protein
MIKQVITDKKLIDFKSKLGYNPLVVAFKPTLT